MENNNNSTSPKYLWVNEVSGPYQQLTLAPIEELRAEIAELRAEVEKLKEAK